MHASSHVLGIVVGLVWLLAVTDAASLLAVGNAEGFDTCCPASCRTDCGSPGITEKECLEKGCCYDPNRKSGMGPWCYYKNCWQPTGSRCAADGLRIDCGNPKIDKNACKARGCCWKPVKDQLSNGSKPWCFFKNGAKLEYQMCCPAEKRRECGHCGIQKFECQARGCCWVGGFDTPCFQKNCDVPVLDICSPDEKRYDCGYPGVDKVLCEKRNCCWDPRQGQPWCYFKNGIRPERNLDTVVV